MTTGDELDIEVVGGSANDADNHTVRKIVAAFDALEGDDRRKVWTNKNLREFCGVNAHAACDRCGEVLKRMGYAYQTATSRKTKRPNTWLWGHPDAIRIARERGY